LINLLSVIADTVARNEIWLHYGYGTIEKLTLTVAD